MINASLHVDRRLRSHRGMTLIEVLVSLVIISVGMLGIAALQMTTLKVNQESNGRTQASLLAADILDRMRANNQGITNLRTQYTVPLDGTGTAATTAGDDLAAWQASIDRLLPSGAGSVAVDATTYVVTITIQWTERAENDRTNRTGTAVAAENAQTVIFVTRTEI